MKSLSRTQGVLLKNTKLPTPNAFQKRYSHQQAINFRSSGNKQLGNTHTNFPVATVFGCSGFLGRYIVGSLSDLGYQVILPHRFSDYDVIGLKCLGDVGQIVPMRFALDKFDTLTDITSRSNIVINALGRDVNKLFDDSMYNSNVYSTEQIVKACNETKVGRYIHVSCINAQANHESKYWATKGIAEETVRNEIPSATIIKPNYIYGTEDRFLNWIAKTMRFTSGVPLVNEGSAKVQPAYCVDVGDAIANAAISRHTVGRTIELNGPEVFTWYELLHVTAKIIEENPNSLNLSPFIAQFFGKLNEFTWGPAFTEDLMVRQRYDSVATENPETHDIMTFEDCGVKPQKLKDCAGQFLAQWNKQDVDHLKIDTKLSIKR
ncbi:NADH dehydrogenase (ubiquinone) 1 alpha subcomplex subunit NDUFA9 [Acrasis kona]|uniref:NADH dehydrogenase (Ubiquinone) 1 alpha subcomplex subunit 9 n=1 Tax=Acrasis kona TaxID=1008807 RepID=A0AAW2YVG7_9EUKA